MINTPNPGNYMQSLTQDVVNIRVAFDAILDAESYLTVIGGVTYLETAMPNGPGLTAGDAAACRGRSPVGRSYHAKDGQSQGSPPRRRRRARPSAS